MNGENPVFLSSKICKFVYQQKKAYHRIVWQSGLLFILRNHGASLLQLYPGVSVSKPMKYLNVS